MVAVACVVVPGYGVPAEGYGPPPPHSAASFPAGLPPNRGPRPAGMEPWPDPSLMHHPQMHPPPSHGTLPHVFFPVGGAFPEWVGIKGGAYPLEELTSSVQSLLLECFQSEQILNKFVYFMGYGCRRE